MDTIGVRDPLTLGVPGGLPELPTLPDFYRLAACRGRPLNWFFPEKDSDVGAYAAAAKDICEGCPVRADCLDYATRERLQGIWGGTVDEERRALRRELGIGRKRYRTRAA